ncbi:MAG: anti-sigma factor family protein [Gemmatimonadaceae bacterium]
MRCADCRDSLNALIDGELDADATTLVRDHIANCEECRRERDMLADTSSLLQEGLVRYPAPDVLKARLRTAFARPRPFEEPARPRASRWMSLAAAGAVIALASSAITLSVSRRDVPPAPESDVLASHLRSLMPGHLTDVASTNQHNVKPWFNGRVDFAPAVPDLDSAGFPLIGGRLDYIRDRPVAAVVYGRRQHMISVYSWPAGGSTSSAPVAGSLRGYHLVDWTADGITYWAVSDLGTQELDTFVRAFIGR